MEKIVGRTLAVDPGSKRIGFAISDDLGLLARPLEVWTRKTLVVDVAHILELVRREEVTSIVVGMPNRLDGSTSPAAGRAEKFIGAIREALAAKQIEVPVSSRDEALTTYAAEEQLKEQGLDWRQIKEKIDAYAAAILLQEELDARRRT